MKWKERNYKHKIREIKGKMKEGVIERRLYERERKRKKNEKGE